ncbi:hypothetical protein CPB97_003274 [Podila verticillata]|nr:hypothetical protein CPB97_003274 [Podila verticillata]
MTSLSGPFLPPEVILLLAPYFVHHRKRHIAQYTLVCKQWHIFFEKLLLMTATVCFTHGADPHVHYPWLEQIARHIRHVHSIRLLGDAESNPTFAPLLPRLNHLETVVITKVTDTILSLLRRNAFTLGKIVYKATANQENMSVRLQGLRRLFDTFCESPSAHLNSHYPSELLMLNGMVISNDNSLGPIIPTAPSCRNKEPNESPFAKLFSFELNYTFLVDSSFYVHMGHRLTTLTLNHCHFSMSPESAESLLESSPALAHVALFPHLETLVLKKTVATRAGYQTMILHCPKLKHLTMRSFHTTNTHLVLKESLAPFPSHQLKSLDVIGGLSDQQVAWILDMLPGLTKLNLGFTGFGQLSAQWLLHRLQGTDPGTGKEYNALSLIRDLDLRGCAHVASDMLDQILQSCPNLIRFHAGLMALTQDMFESKNYQPPEPPMRSNFLSLFSTEPAVENVPVMMSSPVSRWPCLKLRDLRLTICEKRVLHHPSPHLETMFLSQIAKFTQLERLDLSSMVPMGDDYLADPTALSLLIAPFSWTLQGGLAQLSTLRQLKYLALDGFRSRAGQDEVSWMKSHWPRLETLQGVLNNSLEKEWELNSFIEKEWPAVQRLYGRISL